MKKVLGVAVLFLAGIAGGFAIGKMQNPQSKTVESEPAAEAAVEKSDEAEQLEKAKQRILKLERDIATLKQQRDKKAAEESKKAAEKPQEEVITIENGDIMGNLKDKLSPDQFSQVSNAFSELRERMANRNKSKMEFLASVDTSGMTSKERKTHARFQELMAKREAINAKMNGGLPDVGAIKELVELGIEMAPIAKEERSTLMRQMARELGYTGKDVDVVHDAMSNIIDCTMPSGLDNITEMAGEAADVDGGTKVEVKTQVIGI